MAHTQVSSKPQITLHWLDQSRSQRVIWLLNECKGIDYKIDVYKRVNKLAPPELKKVHALGKSPVITVENLPALTTQRPLVLAESGALTEFLCEHFAQHLIPRQYQEGKEGQVGGETDEWLRYRFYMHYAEGSLMTLLLVGLFMDQIRNAPVPFFIKPITRTIAGRVDAMFLHDNYATHFSFLNSQIATSPRGGKFLCGKDLTAADILMSFPLIRGQEKIDAKKNPALMEYITLLENHPGYLASIKTIEDKTGEKFSSNL